MSKWLAIILTLFVAFWATLVGSAPNFGTANGSMTRNGLRRVDAPVWFIAAGQSNIPGQSTQTQLPDYPDEKGNYPLAYQLNDALKILNDPFYPNTDPGPRKSAWPTFTSYWIGSTGRPGNFIMNGWGGACLDYNQWGVVQIEADCAPPAGVPRWDKAGGGDLYCMMLDQANDLSGVSLRAVLWHQGECEAFAGAANGVTLAGYQAALEQFATDVDNDLGIPVIAAMIGPSGGGYDAADVTMIRAATTAAIAANDNLYLGPETNDLEYEDEAHVSDMETLGMRWFERLAALGLVY